jgi:L-aminopeptidase/D-esterase-like protein
MIRPGARNLITDVAGLTVGQAEDHKIRTGVTVVMTDAPCNAVVDVRGGAPGSRETDVLDVVNLVGQVDAIVLSGGSVFGLDAPSGVMSVLRRSGRGYAPSAGVPAAPIVPAAILFDLANGGDKTWGDEAPYRALGLRAAENAGADFSLGNAGAGLGARAGAYKGGLGSASTVSEEGFTVGAVVAVNSLGSPLIPRSDVFWAFPYELEKEFGGRRLKYDFDTVAVGLPPDMRGAQARTHTTIAIVATDADLSRVELKRLAIMASDGLARSIRPAHTPFDGDIVFAIATGKRAVLEPRQLEVMRLGNIAGDCLARAIARGVYEAKTLGDAKSYREVFP